jgi:hypothetical protein
MGLFTLWAWGNVPPAPLVNPPLVAMDIKKKKFAYRINLTS